MRGKLIDDTKNALSDALSKLNPDDSFSIIAFNGESYIFSKSMELASKDAVERAIEWIDTYFVAGGGTNISHPLNKVHLNIHTIFHKHKHVMYWTYKSIYAQPDAQRELIPQVLFHLYVFSD